MERTLELNLRPILDEKYLLLETIGTGGFSTVRLAVEIATGARYAVKIFKSRGNLLEDGRVCLKNFVNEVDCLRKLKHPGLINMIQCSDKGTIVQFKKGVRC